MMITVVSGLSDYGQDLLMQMLRDGGMDLLTNATRKLNLQELSEDFSYSHVRQLRKDNTWLASAQGCVLKVDADLLPYLRADYYYKVVYLDKSMDFLFRDKLNFLSSQGSRTPAASARLIVDSIKLKSARTKNWLVQQNNVDQLFISYESLLLFPQEQANRIDYFLGGRLLTAEMSSVITALPAKRIEAAVGNMEEAQPDMAGV